MPCSAPRELTVDEKIAMSYAQQQYWKKMHSGELAELLCEAMTVMECAGGREFLEKHLTRELQVWWKNHQIRDKQLLNDMELSKRWERYQKEFELQKLVNGGNVGA